MHKIAQKKIIFSQWFRGLTPPPRSQWSDHQFFFVCVSSLTFHPKSSSRRCGVQLRIPWLDYTLWNTVPLSGSLPADQLQRSGPGHSIYIKYLSTYVYTIQCLSELRINFSLLSQKTPLELKKKFAPRVIPYQVSQPRKSISPIFLKFFVLKHLHEKLTQSKFQCSPTSGS